MRSTTTLRIAFGLALLIVSAAVSSPAVAQMGCMQMGNMQMKGTDTMSNAPMAMMPADSGTGTGKIMAISVKDKTLTLAHGNVPGVMMAMTMAYTVSDPAMLRTVSVGDSVAFTLVHRDGNYTITAISQIRKG